MKGVSTGASSLESRLLLTFGCYSYSKNRLGKERIREHLVDNNQGYPGGDGYTCVPHVRVKG